MGRSSLNNDECDGCLEDSSQVMMQEVSMSGSEDRVSNNRDKGSDFREKTPASREGDSASLVSSVTVRVPFHDVDMMEVAWHGNYVKYFEVARCALLDQIQFNYMEMKASGYAWPVVDLRIKYVKPARFGQDLEVICSVAEYEHRLVLDYLIRDRETQQKLTRGKTVQVAVDIETGEMQLVSPDILLEKLGVMQDAEE